MGSEGLLLLFKLNFYFISAFIDLQCCVSFRGTQSDSVTHSFSDSFPVSSYDKILSRAPCAIQ